MDRRQALRSLGALGAGLTLGPTLAMGALGDEQARKAMVASRTVQSGKAGKFTILFTSDIHAQLHTHDEFFLENGKPVYKKRGGYGVLKTMVDTLRNEDPENTIVIDGGDCFQGGGVAAIGAGLGAGMGIGQVMSGAIASGLQKSQPAPAAPALQANGLGPPTSVPQSSKHDT